METASALPAATATPSSKVIETDVVAVQENDEGAPSRVNDYAVLTMLGEGSFSKVYHCKNSHGDEYALKILKKSFLKRKREYKKVEGKMVFCNALEKVQREVAIMKKLAHVNLVKLHEIIDSAADDKMFLVLELVQGGQVMHWDDKAFRYRAAETPDGVLDKETARACMRDVVMALSYLHANHICHRDIKPENILLAKGGVYKLADFGVAHMLDEENKTLLRSTEGTYHFLAPECTTGAEYDPFQVDIWALGVTLYAMLQGTLPFGTKAAGLTQVMDSIRDDPLEFAASVEPDCVEIMQLMLEKDPNKRIRIQDLKVHPWVLDGSDQSRLSRSGSAAVIEVSQQEIEAAFTPVNNFILMTKLKMKMSSRLARARKSVELRHDIDVASASRKPSIVEHVALDASTEAATAALSLMSDICTPRPQPSELVSVLPASQRSDAALASAQVALTRRRSGDLVRATLPAAAAITGTSSESESHEAVAPLPQVHSAFHSGSDTQDDGAAELDKALAPLMNAPAVLSPTSRLSRRMPSSPSSGAMEPRLPPLDMSFSATTSPSQSPAASPMHNERSRDAFERDLQHHCSSARVAPERRRSYLDDVVASVHPMPASALALASEQALDGKSSSPPPSKSSVAAGEPSRSPNGRRAVLQHTRSIESRVPVVRTGKDSSATLPLSEPPVMLQHRKSGLPSPTSAADTYAQALAEAKRKSSLMQRTNWGDKSGGASASDAAHIEDRVPLKSPMKRHDDRDANAPSNANASPPIGGAIPFLPTPRSPSRSCVRAESLVLNTSSSDEFSGAAAHTNFPAPMGRTSSIAKALTECLEPDVYISASKSPARGDSSDTSSNSSSIRSRVGDKSPKVFEKRKSSGSPKRHDIPGTTGAPSSPAPAVSPGKSELAHHWSGPSFGHLEDEIGADSGVANKPRRTSFVRVFSKRRSLLEAQDSLQTIMRRKSSARLAINESRGSEAYESRNHDVDSETDANTVANSGSTVVLCKHPSVRNGPALSALHRASSSHVVEEAPKAAALFRSQKTVVCSVM